MTREERIKLLSDAISTAEMNTTCIQALAFCGVVDVTDLKCLACYCGVSMPGMSRACDILEDRKLITRRRDKGDRRRAWIKITAKGERLLTDMVTLWEENPE